MDEAGVLADVRLSSDARVSVTISDCPPGTSICSECESASGVIQKIKKYFCCSCWIQYCNFRFRKSLLELGKPVKGSTNSYQHDQDLDPKENVLIYFDSTSTSIALLNLIRDAVSAHVQGFAEKHSGLARASGRLPFPFSFTVLYIIDGVTDEGRVDEAGGSLANNETINYLQSWLDDTREKLPRHFPFPLVIRRLAEALSQSNPIDDSKQITDQRIESTTVIPLGIEVHEKLSQILLNLRTKSCRLDFLHILRHRLLVTTAKEMELTKVILPEDQTTLAVSMFSLMSTGRGEQLAEQMNLVSEMNGVQLCRPLIELSSDDLRQYLKVVGVEAPLTRLNPIETIDKKLKIDSMQVQCAQFIVSLQRDYPATVPTLTRIGAKLEPNRDPRGKGIGPLETCTLCQLQLKESGDGVASWCYGCRRILDDMKIPHQELLEHIFLSRQ